MTEVRAPAVRWVNDFFVQGVGREVVAVVEISHRDVSVMTMSLNLQYQMFKP